MCTRTTNTNTGTANATLTTGTRSRIHTLPVVINYDLRIKSISTSAIRTLPGHPFSQTLNYQGGQWNRTKEKLVKYYCYADMLNSNPTVLNERNTFRINMGGEIFLVEITIDLNNNTIEINNVGTPTASLPTTSNEVRSIRQRLRNYHISFENWRSHGINFENPNDPNDFFSSLLKGLKVLGDNELSRIRGIKIRFRHDPPRTHATGGTKESGEYIPNEHVIEIYGSAFDVATRGRQTRFGNLMGIGGNPGNLFPSATITLLHEVGHAISFAEYRIRRENFENALRTMRTNWPRHFRSSIIGGETRYDLDNQDRVEASSRSQYRTDKENFMRALNSKNDWQISDALDPYRRILPGEGLKPFTVYLRELVNGNLSGIDPLQEFFAEGFAMYHCDRTWLQNCQPAIYDFFNSDNHLTIS